MNSLVFAFSIVVLAISTQRILALDFTITNTASNTPGGARYDRDVGVPFSFQTMNDATNFILNTFQQSSPNDRKNVQRVSLYVDNMGGVAYTTSNQIHLAPGCYIGGYSGDLRREFAGVLFHEMAHVWQWNGNGQAPGGLVEGIADFVRLKAGYGPGHWVGPGQGNRWDQGYDVTARFLDYCESRGRGFVAQLNKKMRNGYNNGYFQELLGSSVDQLWRDYKAKYGTA